MNAAANIGLKALLDPDWAGKWWYVPCHPDNYHPVKDLVQGSVAVNPNRALPTSAHPQSGDREKRPKPDAGKSKSVVNLWRDISPASLEEGEWREYAAYQSDVRKRVANVLNRQASVFDKQPHGRPSGEEDPF